MPIFEFVCNDCTHAFEAIVRRTTDARCPQCTSTALTRQLSVFAVGAPGAAAGSSDAVPACGQCGDPRGAGACSLN